MSQITIQCRLVASETTRQQLWQLMAEKNTPLINELLSQIGKHPEFETWRQKGKHPTGIVKELCEPLKTDPRFMGQPARFYTSATASVNYIYKSWFALMKRFQSQLDGKLRWLEMLNSDTELVEASGVSLDILQTKSAEILAQFAPQNPAETQPAKGKKTKKGKKSPTSDSERNLSKNLFDTYSNTEDNLTRCAISYLLKNGCKINNKAENTDKFAQRRRKVEIQIQRLTEKLAARIPKGRDLTDTIRLETTKKGNSAKADRIKRNNLGKIKWNNRETSFKGRIQTIVFTATHDLMTDAIKVAFEDLTEQIKGKKPMKKRMKRNVSSWCKGIVADALKQVSTRVGCTVVSVNGAYTSQLDSRFATLTGSRNGDKFTGHDGVVMHSDTNAADNVLTRMSDVEITRYMKHSDVKVILLERTQKFHRFPNSGN